MTSLVKFPSNNKLSKKGPDSVIIPVIISGYYPCCSLALDSSMKDDILLCRSLEKLSEKEQRYAAEIKTGLYLLLERD